MRDVSSRPGVYDKPVDLDRIPSTPYRFFISQWGGVLTKDGTKWYGCPTKNSIQTVSTRYFGHYEGRPIKCIEWLTQQGNIVFMYKQDRAIYDFDFTNGGKSILEIYLKPSALLNRRTFLATLAVCQQYQSFFKSQGSSKVLYYDIYIQKGIYFVRNQVRGIDSCRACLTNLQRNWNTFENTNKLHTSSPRNIIIGSVSSLKNKNVGKKMDVKNMKKLKAKYDNINDKIEESNYMVQDTTPFTKDTMELGLPETRVGVVVSSTENVKKLKGKYVMDDVDLKDECVDLKDEYIDEYDDIEDLDLSAKEDEYNPEVLETTAALVDSFTLSPELEINKVIDTDMRGMIRPHFYLVSSDYSNIYSACCIDNKIIKDLYTDPQFRGKGYANKLLDWIVKNEDVIGIKPKAFADSPMTDDQLRQWYEKKNIRVF